MQDVMLLMSIHSSGKDKKTNLINKKRWATGKGVGWKRSVMKLKTRKEAKVEVMN
jgi:hypothetical protein